MNINSPVHQEKCSTQLQLQPQRGVLCTNMDLSCSKVDDSCRSAERLFFDASSL